MAAHDPNKTTMALALRCVYALTLLAVLAASSFWTVNKQVAEEAGISAAVANCHRQISRMYRSLKLIEELGDDADGERLRIRRDLKNLQRDMETTHIALVSGDKETGAPPADSPAVRSYVFDEDYDLDRKTRTLVRLLAELSQLPLDQPLATDDPRILEIHALFATNSPIDALEQMASYYQNEEEAKITRLDLLNRWHFFSYLAILSFMSILVFWPMIRRIDGVLANLANLNASLEQRVADRTAALIARARELEASNEALREMRAAMENAVEGIARLGSNQTYLTANASYAKMFGIPAKELLKQGWQITINDDDHGRLKEALDIVREEGKCELELQGLHRQGFTFHLQMMIVSALDKNRKFDGYYLFAKNITARKLVEQALRDSEERFRQMADHIQQVLWLSEPGAERVIYVSPAFEKVFGRTCETLYKSMDAWDTAIHPQDRYRIQSTRQRKQLGGNYDEEYRIVRPDGTVRWIRDRAFPIRRDVEGIERVAGIAEDITHARELQQQILLSQKSFENLIMNCDVAMLVTDSRGEVEFVNPAAEIILQQTADFLRSVPAFIEKETQRDELPLFNEGKQTGIAEVSVIRTEWDGDGAHLVIFRDITDRKLAEEELHAYADELKRSNKELEDFAFVASHDLMEPLRKIKAFGDRLSKRFSGQLGESGQVYLDRMQNAADRMSVLIQDLLTYSRVTTKAQPFKPVDLNLIAKEVLSDLEVRIEMSRGKVIVEKLPTIEADPTQMRQLLQNLIGNALKFRREGVPPVVKVYAEHVLERSLSLAETHFDAEERFNLLVEDNGIGFDEKYLDRIFEVFQRLHGRGDYEGTGTGLAVCRKIAVRHNGSITARSKPDEGTTFVVTLPIVRPKQDS